MILENIDHEPIAEIEYCPHNRWYWLTWLNKGNFRITHPRTFNSKAAAVFWAKWNNSYDVRDLFEKVF